MDFSLLQLLLRYATASGHHRLRDCGLSETECFLVSHIRSHPGVSLARGGCPPRCSCVHH